MSKLLSRGSCGVVGGWGWEVDWLPKPLGRSKTVSET